MQHNLYMIRGKHFGDAVQHIDIFINTVNAVFIFKKTDDDVGDMIAGAELTDVINLILQIFVKDKHAFDVNTNRTQVDKTAFKIVQIPSGSTAG